MLQFPGYKLLMKRGVLILLAATTIGLPCRAQDANDSESSITIVTTTRTITDVLPATLAGIKSTGDIKQFQRTDLSELTGGQTPIFLEYGVAVAAARQYGEYRVEVFQTPNPICAFGLFTYSSPQPVDFGKVKGTALATARITGGAILWDSSFFVRIQAPSRRSDNIQTTAKFWSEIAAILGDAKAPGRLPGLPDSLPPDGNVGQKVRYFRGPRSLGSFVDHATEMFGFEGRAEAVLARYDQKTGDAAAEPIKLLIVEYNTPQFAHDALARATAFAASLPQDEQNKIIIKREGNYIVEAAGIANHELAQQLVDSVKYPYTVKWLKDPHSRHYDRFAGRKAAQIILSSFSIVGVLVLGAFFGGALLGTVIFVRRRRRQLLVFSDAGGMLCLDIEGLCSGMPTRMELAGGLIEGGDN